MPSATPDCLRTRIWDFAQQGQPVRTIAASLGVPVRTVYRLWARFQQAGQATEPGYSHCGRPRSVAFASLHEQVLALRKAHLKWGAGRIYSELAEQVPKKDLPDLSTIRRWLRQAGLAPRPSRRLPRPPRRATRPHQIWQLDAAEQKSLRSGLKVCWLRLVDEASGAVLFSWVFVFPRWSDVPALAVQATLQVAFALWGRPEGLRVDNGVPWVCPGSDLPSDMELWLAGLGIALYRNRPRRPQDNALVERSQRTAADWAEPDLCDTPEQLQQRLDAEDRVQREVYLFDGKQTRLQAFPDLRLLGRSYMTGSWEDICWDLEAALRCLAERPVQRKVDRDGYVSLYDHRHRAGKAYDMQIVTVKLDAERQEWVLEQEGKEVGRSAATEYLRAERIRGLRIRRRQGRSARQTQKCRAKKQQARQEQTALAGEGEAVAGNRN